MCRVGKSETISKTYNRLSCQKIRPKTPLLRPSAPTSQIRQHFQGFSRAKNDFHNESNTIASKGSQELACGHRPPGFWEGDQGSALRVLPKGRPVHCSPSSPHSRETLARSARSSWSPARVQTGRGSPELETVTPLRGLRVRSRMFDPDPSSVASPFVWTAGWRRWQRREGGRHQVLSSKARPSLQGFSNPLGGGAASVASPALS